VRYSCGYKQRIPEDGVTTEIQEERIRQLNEEDVRDGDYVLYWMQQSQRAEYNHALEHAAQRANELGQPLLVVFGLTDDYRRRTRGTTRFCWRDSRTSRRPSGSAG